MKKLILSVSVLLSTVSIFAQPEPKGLNVNDTAPDFSAKDQDGKILHLKDQLKNGAVVLVFYRGQWCPFCNRQLKKLEDSLSLITGKGASLVAISPEKPENIAKTIEKTKASYPILFDDGLTIMKSYDVAFAVDDKTIEKYKTYGIDFSEVNGSTNGANLPVPAIYVISKEGKIVFRHFDKNYTKRASVADILDHL
jgi:peroxiredoxin